ncbi:MAG: ABC transporter substrate-binding protein [Alphaproteobacteria bacterium]
MKKLLSLSMAAALGFSGLAHGQETLKMWSITNELEPVIADFEAKYDVKVDLTVVALEDYLSKLIPVLKDKKNAPDLFVAEVQIIKEFVDRGVWANLSKEYDFDQYKEKIFPYVWGVGTDKNGDVRATSYQATPGGFFYRRSIAKQVLGTDDPVQIEGMMDSWDKFIQVGEKLRDATDGKVKVVAGVEGLSHAFLASRQNPWVDAGGNLIVDPKMDEYMKVAKELADKNLVGAAQPFTPGWMSGLSNGEVFGYFLPTWGLHYVIKGNAPDTKGDWAVVQGPSAYFWGGSWIGVNAKSKKKDLAAKFVEMLTIDDEYMEHWARSTGDFVSNMVVEDKLSGELTEDFLNGQNAHAFFAKAAAAVGELKFVQNMTRYDRALNGAIESATKDYAQGGLSKEDAMKGFYEFVQSTFPKVKISQ